MSEINNKKRTRKMSCPFCPPHTLQIQSESNHLLVFRDKFPVSPGHTLIIPKRHVASFFELTGKERNEIWPLLDQVRSRLTAEFNPDGFNIGWNDGAAAGQTIFHLHLHIIPRFTDDVEDPRGGIRWVIPKTAKYWDDK